MNDPRTFTPRDPSRTRTARRQTLELRAARSFKRALRGQA